RADTEDAGVQPDHRGVARPWNRRHDDDVQPFRDAILTRALPVRYAEELVRIATGGIWVAFATAGVVVRSLPPLRDLRAKLLPNSIDVRVNWRVLSFAIGVSSATLLFFILTPAMAA